MTSGGVTLFILTLITCLVLAAVLTTVIGADGRGDRDIFLGLRWILAAILVFAAWIWMSGLLLIAGAQGVLPALVRTAAWLLSPASGAAAFAALYIAYEQAKWWPAIIPVSIPLLIAGYVAALYQPSLRPAFADTTNHLAVWGLVTALSVSVWPFVAMHVNEKAQRDLAAQRRSDELFVREKEQKRSESLAKLQTMSADAHLVEWYTLLDPENGVRTEALQALRKVRRRQGDVEEGLSYGIPRVMTLVPDLELEPTPRLCESAKAWLAKTSQEMHASNGERRAYQLQPHVEETFPGIRWFVTHGCNCSDGITAIANVIRSDYLDSPDRRKILAGLDSLKP